MAKNLTTHGTFLRINNLVNINRKIEQTFACQLPGFPEASHMGRNIMGIDLLNRAQRYLKIAEGLTDLEDKASAQLLATQLADISKIEVVEIPFNQIGGFSEEVSRMQQIISSAYKIDALNPIVLESLFGEVLASLPDQRPIDDDKNA